MALQCNIDQRGRRFRIAVGAVVDASGTALVIAGVLLHNPYLWGPGLGAMIGGTFMIFEGAAGWCAARAMGIKTKL